MKHIQNPQVDLKGSSSSFSHMALLKLDLQNLNNFAVPNGYPLGLPPTQ